MASIVFQLAVKLRLHSTMRIHPTFHVSQLKLVSYSPLSPPSEPPPQLIDGYPVFIVRKLLDLHRCGRGFQ